MLGKTETTDSKEKSILERNICMFTSMAKIKKTNHTKCW